MELRVNDYVRTECGIAKIIGTEAQGLVINLDKAIMIYHPEYIASCTHDEIIKSSPNIIDLLELMDLLYIDISPDDCGGIVVPRIPETLNELEKYIEKIKSGEYILKYVVTHEQLENNMYEVGE